MLVKVINIFVCIIVLAAASCSTSKIRETSNTAYIPMVISITSSAPHSSYEVWKLKEHISSDIKEHTSWDACISLTPEATSCKMLLGNRPFIFVGVNIEKIAGISDNGQVHGGQVEGYGYVRAAVTVKNTKGEAAKKYILEDTLKPTDTNFTRGVGYSLEKIAHKVIGALKEDIVIEVIVTESSSEKIHF